MRRSICGAAFTLLAFFTEPLLAQDAPFFFPAPSARVSKDVEYGRVDTTTLRMDVYRPSSAKGATPVLVLFNVAVGQQRGNSFYKGWARAAASKGIVAIVPDLHGDQAERDFQLLVDHLYSNAKIYGADRDAIAVYAGSGNVYTALPIIENPTQTRVKAAAIYYGTGPVNDFRRDLPILFVRAGLDRASMNGNATSGMTALVASAIAQNAPVSVINNPGGHHAFEMIDDDAATRDVIDRTLDFVKRATSVSYQTALRHTLPEATAAGDIIAGNYRSAAAAYAGLVNTRPNDTRLRLSYGEALLGDKQYDAACSQFEQLKGKGLGPRDLGLPAARACMLKGDSSAAIAWLQTIPKRFLPSSLQQDSTFASLRDRADFKSLFQP